MEKELELERLNALLLEHGGLKYIQELISRVKLEIDPKKEESQIVSNGTKPADEDDSSNGSIEETSGSKCDQLPTTTPEVGDHDSKVKKVDQDQEDEKLSISRAPKNPLENEYILRHIFNFCSVPTLKACRLVNPEWRDISLSAWRNKAVLRLGYCETSTSTYPRGEINFDEFNKLYDSEDDAHQLKMCPFKNYRIFLDDDDNEDEKKAVNVISSLTTVPIHHIAFCNFKDRSSVFVERFLSKFPHLESLELFDCELFGFYIDKKPSGDSTEPYRHLNLKRLKIAQTKDAISFGEWQWSTLLSLLPKLEALTIHYNCMDRVESVHDVQKVFEQIHKERKKSIVSEDGPWSLKELEVWNIPDQDSSRNMNLPTDKLLQRIGECDFPLEKLTIDLGRIRGDFRVDHIFKSCCSTLKYLKFTLFPTPHSSWMPFFRRAYQPECMGALREVIIGNAFPWGLHVLNNLDVPNLEKLTLEYSEDNGNVGLDVSFPKGTVFQKLHTFEYLENHKIPSPDTVKAFANMKPNLVHLTIPLNVKTFQIVCQRFKKLKTLDILTAQCDYIELNDETLTGYPVGFKIEDNLSRPSNITDLKDLTDLSISCQRQLRMGEVRFTDHAVLHGFLQLPKLHQLSIAFRTLSDDVKSKLLDHVKGEVHFQKADDPSTQEYSEYCDVEVNDEYDIVGDALALDRLSDNDSCFNDGYDERRQELLRDLEDLESSSYDEEDEGDESSEDDDNDVEILDDEDRWTDVTNSDDDEDERPDNCQMQ